MYSFFEKKIIVAVTGSIAAYKSAVLVRLLVKNGATVKVIMTPSAADFITPLTLGTLSKHDVISSVHSAEGWNDHVGLGLWADAIVVAPCTANTLAKLANGICDNIVAAVYLSARCPIFIAPAMDVDMWHHPATQRNIDLLVSYKNHLLPVGNGELASGLHGEGRMAEPEEICEFLHQHFTQTQLLKGKKILVTAGPTYEAIDPVRFIGNRSSGKMGISIANALAQRGAEVVLVLGPSKYSTNHTNIKTIRVEDARQMLQECEAQFSSCEAAIFSAAVADYRPENPSDIKIKKKGDHLTLELIKNPDIAATLGAIKRENQFIVGFALETNNELEHATEKLRKKNFDFVVLNSLQDKGAGFGHDTNKVSFLFKDNKIKNFELKSKDDVALDIANELQNLLLA